jgi:5-methyltetrahydrofolate--homocysteine methyltransferase
MVGGAPLTESFAEEIGVDGFSPDAGAAVRKAKELIG